MNAPIQPPPMDPWAKDVRASDVPVVPGSNPLASDDFETFGDDERLAREHAEYFYEEYLP